MKKSENSFLRNKVPFKALFSTELSKASNWNEIEGKIFKENAVNVAFLSLKMLVEYSSSI